ncbi:hypothetical protein [Mesorhizobium kowhaii]|uniref:hypothetical protein n=1 Tax=Mesorhizobium kowhaii TaxID=1300272 RepID=UPI00142E4FB7|nr:hypothetical protein [Mesorhizobium kowhaii]
MSLDLYREEPTAIRINLGAKALISTHVDGAYDRSLSYEGGIEWDSAKRFYGS